MPSAEYYHGELQRLGLLQFNINAQNAAEAKFVKKDLSLRAKQLRAVRSALSNEQKAIRAEAANRRPSAGAGGSIVLTVFGKRGMAGWWRAASKRSLTHQAASLLEPYERVMRLIDNVLLQIDVAKVQIDEYVLTEERRRLS